MSIVWIRSKARTSARKSSHRDNQRQLVRLVAVSVIPAALAAALLIGYSYDRQSKIIEQRTLETARALAQAVDRELASGQAALLVLATSPHLASGDLAAFHRQAQDAIRDLPGDSRRPERCFGPTARQYAAAIRRGASSPRQSRPAAPPLRNRATRHLRSFRRPGHAPADHRPRRPRAPGRQSGIRPRHGNLPGTPRRDPGAPEDSAGLGGRHLRQPGHDRRAHARSRGVRRAERRARARAAHGAGCRGPDRDRDAGRNPGRGGLQPLCSVPLVGGDRHSPRLPRQRFVDPDLDDHRRRRGIAAALGS